MSTASKPAVRELSVRELSVPRYAAYKKWVQTIDSTEGGLDKFSEGYKTMGFQVLPNGDIQYREWAPGAVTANLIGDFSECRFWVHGSRIPVV